MKTNRTPNAILRALLWLTVSGGVIALFLLIFLAGMTLRYGMAGLGDTPLLYAVYAAALGFCAGASVLTVLRLLGKCWLPWLHTALTLMAASVLVYLLPSQDPAVQNAWGILAAPVVITLIQAALHLLHTRREKRQPLPARSLPARQITFAQIVSVTHEALLWRDEAGETQAVDLPQCAQNWNAAHPGASGQCVGERWAPTHFLLYADEPVALVNSVQRGTLQHLLDHLRIPLRLDHRQYDSFRQVQQMLLDSGWTTCDMT